MKRANGSTSIARGSVLSIGVLALVLLAPTIAQANAPRVTQGDARAIFEAQSGGGWVIRLNGGTLEGAPSDFLSQIEFDLTLDGTPLDTMRSAIKRMLNPGLRGFVEAFSVHEGQVMAPEGSLGRPALAPVHGPPPGTAASGVSAHHLLHR